MEGSTVTKLKKVRVQSKGKILKKYTGLIYIAPWLIGFLIFQLYPLLSSLYDSFTDLS